MSTMSWDGGERRSEPRHPIEASRQEYAPRFEIERATMSDRTTEFFLLHRIRDGRVVRFWCLDERAAGDLADVLCAHAASIEVEAAQ